MMRIGRRVEGVKSRYFNDIVVNVYRFRLQSRYDVGDSVKGR
jgi:hypothetical protein